MKNVLVLVAADPRRSDRAAEGFRVADGLALAEDLVVAVLVCGPAAEAFGAAGGGIEAWHDGHLLVRHLMALRRQGAPVRLVGEVRSAFAVEAGIRPVTDAEAATLRHGVDVAIEF